MNAKRTRVCSIRKEAALANIKIKISVLRNWATVGIPELSSASGLRLVDKSGSPVLDFFPTSLRQFKLWNGLQNSPDTRSTLPKFSATGNDTLASYSDLTQQVQELISLLAVRARSQRESTTAPENVRLRNELAAERAAARMRVAELRELRRQFVSLQRELDRVRNESQGHSAELHRVHADLEESLASERRRNADLARRLAQSEVFGRVKT